VYSPYIIMNKTLLPFDLAAKTWTGGQKPVAGSDLFKSESPLRYRELADGLQMTTIETPLRHSVRFQPLSQEPPLILPFCSVWLSERGSTESPVPQGPGFEVVQSQPASLRFLCNGS